MSARVELHENLRRPVRKMDPGLALGDHGARREAVGVDTELVMSGSLVARTGIQCFDGEVLGSELERDRALDRRSVLRLDEEDTRLARSHGWTVDQSDGSRR